MVSALYYYYFFFFFAAKLIFLAPLAPPARAPAAGPLSRRVWRQLLRTSNADVV